MEETVIVDRKSYKLESFLRKLTKHLTLADTFNWVEGEDIWYLGGGCWRAKAVRKDTLLIGVVLINPSKTADEINTVAAAMNVLL